MTGRPMVAGLLIAVGTLAAAPALAASGGMPQLNFHDFPPQLVWLLIVFAALYLVLSKVALPKVGEVLQMRADRIKGDLDRAAALPLTKGVAIDQFQCHVREPGVLAQDSARGGTAFDSLSGIRSTSTPPQ